MPNIRYYLSTARSKSHSGLTLVHARLYDSHLNLRAPTRILAPTELWSDADGRCRVSKRYETPQNRLARDCNTQLDELADYIFNKYYTAIPPLPQSWLKTTIAEYYDAPSSQHLSELIIPYAKQHDLAPATTRKLLSLRSLILSYERNHQPLTTTLTTDDLHSFHTFLAADHSLNSITSRLKQLRAVLLSTRPAHNPFDDFTIAPERYGSPIYLTEEERDYLTIFPDLSESKAIQRDIFIFQCHVGCRIADLYALTPANIVGGWLRYIPSKTAKDNPTTISVPLTQTAQQIVARYAGRDIRHRLFPFITMPRYNDAIRYICRVANLDRPVIKLDTLTMRSTAHPLYEVVSSHVARKTFAQILYSKTHDRRLVASMTGHSESSQAFNRYSEVTDEMKVRAVIG